MNSPEQMTKIISVRERVPTSHAIEEHINILHPILQFATSPLDLVEEELVLEAARHLQGYSSIACRYAMVDRQFSLNRRLNRGLQMYVSCSVDLSDSAN